MESSVIADDELVGTGAGGKQVESERATVAKEGDIALGRADGLAGERLGIRRGECVGGRGDGADLLAWNHLGIGADFDTEVVVTGGVGEKVLWDSGGVTELGIDHASSDVDRLGLFPESADRVGAVRILAVGRVDGEADIEGTIHRLVLGIVEGEGEGYLIEGLREKRSQGTLPPY